MEAEVQDCRRHWLYVCEEVVNERQKTDDSLRKYNFSALTLTRDEVHLSPQAVNVCSYYSNGQKYIGFIFGLCG